MSDVEPDVSQVVTKHCELLCGVLGKIKLGTAADTIKHIPQLQAKKARIKMTKPTQERIERAASIICEVTYSQKIGLDYETDSMARGAAEAALTADDSHLAAEVELLRKGNGDLIRMLVELIRTSSLAVKYWNDMSLMLEAKDAEIATLKALLEQAREALGLFTVSENGHYVYVRRATNPKEFGGMDGDIVFSYRNPEQGYRDVSDAEKAGKLRDNALAAINEATREK